MFLCTISNPCFPFRILPFIALERNRFLDSKLIFTVKLGPWLILSLGFGEKSIPLKNCETKSGTESPGLRLTFSELSVAVGWWRKVSIG